MANVSDIAKKLNRKWKEDVLADFLRENRAEVVKVTQLDYTFDRQITLERNEAREEGWKEGREEGRAEEKVEIARKLLEMNSPVNDIAKATGLSIEEIERLRHH